jgi:hypothetical protein
MRESRRTAHKRMANDFGSFVPGLFCETREVVYYPKSTKEFRMAIMIVSGYSCVPGFYCSARRKSVETFASFNSVHLEVSGINCDPPELELSR